MLSLAEENYLKSIFHLSRTASPVSTNEIAEALKTTAASVTEMIKRLSAKSFVSYQKYHGVVLTVSGEAAALTIVRKHRLWECFLVEKLGLAWDEVHDVAEQLEHIQSPLLIEKLDTFLGRPVTDPHGHPIPDKNGKMKAEHQQPLSEGEAGSEAFVASVRNSSAQFLQYLDKLGIKIGTQIIIEERTPFDGSITVVVAGKRKQVLSREVSDNILIRK